MPDVKQIVDDVLRKGYLMSLATVDENGPWVADVIYTFDDDFNIYWISDGEARHSKAILGDQRVAATITPSDRPGMPNVGLQIEGEAKRIEGDLKEMAIRLNIKKGKPAQVKEGEVLERMHQKYGSTHYWFCMKPKKIELLYQTLFGFKKQPLEF